MSARIGRLASVAVIGIAAAIGAAGPARASDVPGGGVTFAFQYSSGAEHWPPQARAALESAGATVASYLTVPQPVIIDIDVVGLNSPGDTNIAASFVGFTGNDTPGFFPTVVQEKILTGNDANGATPDGQITYNFAEPWGVDPVPGDQYDFTTVAIHELLHVLGFLSGSEGPGSENRNWTTYDSFLRAADGTPVIDEAFALKPQYAATLTGADGGLFFDGSNAVSAFGGPVPLFTPAQWATASRSVSHVDGLPGYLMDPFYGYGPGVREITPVEMAMLRDLGYVVNPPPPAI